MYNLFDDVRKVKYGDNVRLAYTDIDSHILEITTNDVYEDFRGDDQTEQFDFSDYHKNHPNYNTDNKKVLGKFKCETHGTIIYELIALRPKMYALKVPHATKERDREKKVAKGIPNI